MGSAPRAIGKPLRSERTGERDVKKQIYILGGTMGVGKSTVSRVLKERLNNSVFLDGDWCWDAHPFQVTEETKRMVLRNICFLLNQFIRCSAYENVIFCWVLHQQNHNRYYFGKHRPNRLLGQDRIFALRGGGVAKKACQRYQGGDKGSGRCGEKRGENALLPGAGHRSNPYGWEDPRADRGGNPGAVRGLY